MKIDFQPWPYAVRSFGYYPPEVIVQVPMDVFVRLLKEGGRRPSWADNALGSEEQNVLMQARSFYELTGPKLPEWLTPEALEEAPDSPQTFSKNSLDKPTPF